MAAPPVARAVGPGSPRLIIPRLAALARRPRAREISRLALNPGVLPGAGGGSCTSEAEVRCSMSWLKSPSVWCSCLALAGLCLGVQFAPGAAPPPEREDPYGW